MDKSQIQRELRYQASRSSGSGGQHVNKTSSRIELFFNVDASQGLNPSQKEQIKMALKTRLTKDNILIISAQNSRSQVLNRNAATTRFFKLIEKALAPRKMSKGAPQLKANPGKRLESKKKKSQLKSSRKKVIYSKDDL